MEAHITIVLFFFSESSSHKQTYSRKKLTWNLEFLLGFQVLGISFSIGSTFYCSCSVSGVDVGFRCGMFMHLCEGSPNRDDNEN